MSRCRVNVARERGTSAYDNRWEFSISSGIRSRYFNTDFERLVLKIKQTGRSRFPTLTNLEFGKLFHSESSCTSDAAPAEVKL